MMSEADASNVPVKSGRAGYARRQQTNGSNEGPQKPTANVGVTTLVTRRALFPNVAYSQMRRDSGTRPTTTSAVSLHPASLCPHCGKAGLLIYLIPGIG